jgi:nickel-dependent lactate racemase
MKIPIPYGKCHLNVSVPDANVCAVLSAKAAAGRNAKKLLIRALRRRRLPFGDKNVLVAVPDLTRSAHVKEILPVVIEWLSSPGRHVDIIVATGMHAPLAQDELKGLLGAGIVKRIKVLRHDASEAACINKGNTVYGVPIVLDKMIFAYDRIVSVGLVEPHLYAGYSGGAKTVAIGLAGSETIDVTHGIRFLDDAGTRIGSIAGNKFQETLWHIVEKAPPAFFINIVNSSDAKALSVFSGEGRGPFEKSVSFAESVFRVKTNTAADIVLCGIGYPKDVNLYQASRALNYVLATERPVVRPGGVLIIAAELADGAGKSVPEKRFFSELLGMKDARSFLDNVRRCGCVAGVHRAYMTAKALASYDVIFVTRALKEYARSFPFTVCGDIANALEKAFAIRGKHAKINIIPRSLATIAGLDSA